MKEKLFRGQVKQKLEGHQHHSSHNASKTTGTKKSSRVRRANEWHFTLQNEMKKEVDNDIRILEWQATRCLKITEKVSINIASKASYTYILNGQK